MPHRDDQEAARQRIEALERDLADARADVASAKADAQRARVELSRAPAPSPKSVAKAERAAKRKRKPPTAAAATESEPSWAPGARRRFSISIGVLAGLAYGSAAFVFGTHTGEGMNVALAASGAALGAMVVGAFALARIHGAPEAFGASLVTLLISAMVLGGVGFGWMDEMWAELLSPGPLLTALQIVASLIVVGIGAVVSANWVTDAASSPIQPDP